MFLNNKAEMGIGGLVIFIALILVVTVTAGVLIQSSSTLQQKALLTGRESTSQVATHIDALEIAGSDGRTGNLTNISMIMKLSPGSDSVVLEQSILRMWDTTYADTYTYAQGNRTATEFNLTYLQKSDGWLEGHIKRGDVVKITWTTLTPIIESQHVCISFLPKTGTITNIWLNAPEVFDGYLMYLYP